MIIAVDFDGILCQESESGFPSIGLANSRMVAFVKELIAEGHEVILWTCRVDDALDRAVEWCKDHGIEFCAVNENAPSNIAQWSDMYPNGTRKVYADIYIDDHCPWYWNDARYIGPSDATEYAMLYTRRMIECLEKEN